MVAAAPGAGVSVVVDQNPSAVGDVTAAVIAGHLQTIHDDHRGVSRPLYVHGNWNHSVPQASMNDPNIPGLLLDADDRVRIVLLCTERAVFQREPVAGHGGIRHGRLELRL